MADPKPPASVTVGPYTHKVVVNQATIDRIAHENGSGCELWGNFNAATQQITLNPSLPADMLRVTLVHELLHACTELAGRPCGEDTEDDERVVRLLAPILTDLLRSNPSLVAFLLHGSSTS